MIRVSPGLLDSFDQFFPEHGVDALMRFGINAEEDESALGLRLRARSIKQQMRAAGS